VTNAAIGRTQSRTLTQCPLRNTRSQKCCLNLTSLGPMAAPYIVAMSPQADAFQSKPKLLGPDLCVGQCVPPDMARRELTACRLRRSLIGGSLPVGLSASNAGEPSKRRLNPQSDIQPNVEHARETLRALFRWMNPNGRSALLRPVPYKVFRSLRVRLIKAPRSSHYL